MTLPWTDHQLSATLLQLSWADWRTVLFYSTMHSPKSYVEDTVTTTSISRNHLSFRCFYPSSTAFSLKLISFHYLPLTVASSLCNGCDFRGALLLRIGSEFWQRFRPIVISPLTCGGRNGNTLMYTDATVARVGKATLFYLVKIIYMTTTLFHTTHMQTQTRKLHHQKQKYENQTQRDSNKSRETGRLRRHFRNKLNINASKYKNIK